MFTQQRHKTGKMKEIAGIVGQTGGGGRGTPFRQIVVWRGEFQNWLTGMGRDSQQARAGAPSGTNNAVDLMTSL